MDELLDRRIQRALEALTDDQAYKVLDYIEFLQSKYGDRSRQPSTLEKLANGVEDTLRVSRVPMAAIKGTRDVIDTAGKVMKGLADAGKSMVDELQEQLTDAVSPGDADRKDGPEGAPDAEPAEAGDAPGQPAAKDPARETPETAASEEKGTSSDA